MSENKSLLGQKLLSIQKKIGAVTKSSSNPHFRSKYADLNEVLEVSKEALHSEGLYVTQPCGKDQHGQFVETRISDVDGFAINSVVYLSGHEDNMQKIGAAITYARRYGLVSLLGLEQEDDDAETAVGRGRYEAPKSTEAKSTKGPSLLPKVSGSAQDQDASRKEELLKALRQTVKTGFESKKIFPNNIEVLIKEQNEKAQRFDDLTDRQAAVVLAKLQEKLK